MKIIAINSSPKMDEGNTAMILKPFLYGMKEADAQVELFHTKKMKVNLCQGDYACWIKTPGKCIHKGVRRSSHSASISTSPKTPRRYDSSNSCCTTSSDDCWSA